MLRLVRLLPVVIPVVRAALRNPKVREILKLKPLGGQDGRDGTPRGRR